MSKRDKDRDRDDYIPSTPSRPSQGATPSRPSQPTYSAPNPNAIVGLQYEGARPQAHMGASDWSDNGSGRAPVNQAGAAKPEPGVNPSVPVDTDKPVAGRRPTGLSISAKSRGNRADLSSRSARLPRGERGVAKDKSGEAGTGASRNRAQAKPSTVRKARTHDLTDARAKPLASKPAKRSDPRDARQMCKARPKDNRPKGGGGGKKKFVPWKGTKYGC